MKNTVLKRTGAGLLLAAFALSALSVPALAAEFTSSVTAKQAPAVVTTTTESGEEVAAIIYDENDEEVIGIEVGDLIVTPLSEAEEAEETISTALTSAYKQVQSVTTLDELTDGDDLETELRSQSRDVAVEDLVVYHMFDVTVTGTVADYLAVDGHYVKIRFDLGLSLDDILIVLHNYKDNLWETIGSDRIERHDDGSVSVTFYSLSPVAFITNTSAATSDSTGSTGSTGSTDSSVTSPKTGELDTTPAIWGAVALGAAAVVCFILSARKKDRA
ncbi:MAG: hypothetical protein LUD69_02790 [Oscillospiraceae bacterium]|nr:hypothetical protein [Oscillospiraceae bacterium]